VTLLAGVTERLQGLWSGFVQEEVQVVEQYEGRSKMMIQQGVQRGGGGRLVGPGGGGCCP
jgi:hypothetical protein